MNTETPHSSETPETPEIPHTTAKSVRFWQRKAPLILLAVLAALAIFGTTTQTWIHVSIGQGEVAQSDLNIPGSKAAVAVSALALVALAGALATSIAGKIARIVTAMIMFLSAAGIVAVVFGIVADPAGAAMAEVGVATGIEGEAANATTTFFPVLAIVAALVLAVASLLVLFFGRSWNVRTKYDAARPAQAGGPAEAVDEIDRWDQLSRGEDPTD
ncbi:Trp biosynthesis-associated membrane protein [Arthrobacter sp. H35-D1]|uniref:Trp biosynthesis-associated membrane protein n=1 Tax=Arthrobacter sp. H35-D1 TaxID=3046202 RepID=UPI0024B8A7F6|nr:Trp biosynthesis-associated membrane protein [Arthrobacter sp. H35-D1]MDJ0314687.1 Trp biosynthesis-associated membrane protein [Arthrobacter sp. H35-D1]